MEGDRVRQDALQATRTMTVPIFSRNETSSMLPEPNTAGRTSPFGSAPWKGGGKMETYKKMGWVWAALLVYAIGVSM